MPRKGNGFWLSAKMVSKSIHLSAGYHELAVFDYFATKAKDKSFDPGNGDIILLFSNGLIDNLWPLGFESCIERYLVDGVLSSLNLVAHCLVEKAYRFSMNEDYMSPG